MRYLFFCLEVQNFKRSGQTLLVLKPLVEKQNSHRKEFLLRPQQKSILISSTEEPSSISLSITRRWF